MKQIIMPLPVIFVLNFYAYKVCVSTCVLHMYLQSSPCIHIVQNVYPIAGNICQEKVFTNFAACSH